MLAGRMRHGDNQGNTGLLGPGSVQWMTAGRGIVHSEFPEQEEGLMWGFQLWVNLPRTDKMTAPRYQDIQGDDVPEVELGPGARARVLVGTVGGVDGPRDGRRDRARVLRSASRRRRELRGGAARRPQRVRVRVSGRREDRRRGDARSRAASSR